MLVYKWMGQAANVTLDQFESSKWMIMLEQPGQRYCMGVVELVGHQYISRAKGHRYKAPRRIDAVISVMDYMHNEAMAEKMALQSIVVDNLLSMKS